MASRKFYFHDEDLANAFKQGVEYGCSDGHVVPSEPEQQPGFEDGEENSWFVEVEDGDESEDPCICQNCGHEDEAVEFYPSDGNRAPLICPECGGTNCFITV